MCDGRPVVKDGKKSAYVWERCRFLTPYPNGMETGSGADTGALLMSIGYSMLFNNSAACNLENKVRISITEIRKHKYIPSTPLPPLISASSQPRLFLPLHQDPSFTFEQPFVSPLLNACICWCVGGICVDP